jgi:predicted O-methyltransferase YrrM
MKFFDTLVRMVRNSDRSIALMSKLVESVTNQSTDVNKRLDKVIEALLPVPDFYERLDRSTRIFLERFGHRNIIRRGSHPAVDVTPIIDIPFPTIDLDKINNPTPAIVATQEFAQTVEFFANNPVAERSLVSSLGQALIYTVIRNQHPMHVVEIGTFRGGTTEVISRAVFANGSGVIHTIGPFDSDLFPPVFAHWPPELRAQVTFYPIDSMVYFMEMERLCIRPSLVFVDGMHDYEFASFDIQCAARRLTPGGFIFIDNVEQAGPYFAAVDFLERHPDWIDCGCASSSRNGTRAFDRSRSNIPGTDFMVLRAPSSYFYVLTGERPCSFGDGAWNKPRVTGLRLSLDGKQKSGTLHVQCMLRGFSLPPGAAQTEVLAETSQRIDAGTTDVEVTFEKPAVLEPGFARYSAEPWLIWTGEGPLRISALPVPI